MVVSTKCHQGLDSHSWASKPRKIVMTVTLRAMSLLSLMIDSMNRMAVREVMVKVLANGKYSGEL